MALLPLIRDSVVALIAMALLPSSSFGVTIVVAALPSLLISRCPCHHPNGIVALIRMVLLLLMHRLLC
jgi:hypothetical protein